jgi:alkylation response protein AidB-like acyl-CoA dehydrogenase
VEKDGDAYRLTGSKRFVTDGALANLIVVAARRAGSTGDEGVGLFVVQGDADGLTREPLETLDPTRKQAALDLAGVRATALGDPEAGWSAIENVLDHVAVCLSAEMVGGAQRCLDMAVQYAKDRIQFGRPIGQFQAIKHKCADILLQTESAKTAAYYAMWAAAKEDEELRIVAPLAKAYCADAFFFAASENIQVHGGIGFTWEHDCHLYFKRAKSSELLFGDPVYHRELLARRLGI